MIQAYPRVACQSLLVGLLLPVPQGLATHASIQGLMSAYESLFTEPCTRCSRTLSTEGHMPPTGRVWTEGEGGESARWVARHVTCRAL